VVFKQDLGETKDIQFDDCLERSGEGSTKVFKEGWLGDCGD
jgi:hypothetical protein